MRNVQQVMVWCENCGKPFDATRLDAKTCSPKCRVGLHRAIKSGNAKSLAYLSVDAKEQYEIMKKWSTRIEAIISEYVKENGAKRTAELIQGMFVAFSIGLRCNAAEVLGTFDAYGNRTSFPAGTDSGNADQHERIAKDALGVDLPELPEPPYSPAEPPADVEIKVSARFNGHRLKKSMRNVIARVIADGYVSHHSIEYGMPDIPHLVDIGILEAHEDETGNVTYGFTVPAMERFGGDE